MVKEAFDLNQHLDKDYVKVIEAGIAGIDFTEEDFMDKLAQKGDLLELGVCCLLAFIQQGWTGPSIDWSSHAFLGVNGSVKEWNAKWLKALICNGEEPYHLVDEPFLLSIAKSILFHSSLDIHESIEWWRARLMFVNQKILENYAEDCKNLILENYEAVSRKLNGADDRVLKARCHLELGMVHHYYGNHARGLEEFESAQESTGFVWSSTGILGKRTKFQTFETSQLAIVASSALNIEDTESNVPVAHDLNDDILLEKVEFSESNKQDQLDQLKGNLNPVDQCILLAFCLNVKNTNPADGLTSEQMAPFVSRVLENPNNWMITTMALLLKSRLESNKSRTVERACLQLQTLVDQWKYQENDATVSARMEHLFSLMLPSKWEMEKELGERFTSLGVVRSALEIFERLEMWENAISCHQMLEQGKKADELITKLLNEQGETPKLYCLLGDVRGDKSLYEKAWELSNQKFARAMRSLGSYYFSAQEYEKSVECYGKALAINSMFDNSWFVMGCAALRFDDFESASTAFMRVVQIDPENSEAWNNLASVYIKQKKLKEAFGCLKESTKLNYDASNVWENYLFVCVDIGNYAEAIRAIERIFDIRIDKQEKRDTALDEPVLEVLVTCICEGAPDEKMQDSTIYIPRLEKLLLKISHQYATSKFYSIIAQFYHYQKDYLKWIEYKEKVYRKMLNDPLLAESQDVFDALVDATLDLSKAYYESRNLTQKPRMGDEELPVCPTWAYSAKMALKAVIGRTKTNFGMTEGHEKLTQELSFIIAESKQ